jgi:putative Holliday junction resolvase
MALDVGNRRIGVALSDPSRTLSRGLQVIQRRSGEADRALIARLVCEHEVEKIVVGHPLHLDGSVGEQARRVEEFATQLREAVGVSVVLWDESYSTERARQVMIEAGTKRDDRKKRLDAVAAAVILQDYLDSLRLAAGD